MSKLTKFIFKPGLFFRDYFIKRYPLDPNAAKRVAGGASAVPRATVLAAPAMAVNQSEAPKKLASAAKKPIEPPKRAASSPLKFYNDNYELIAVERNVVLLDCFWGRRVGCHPYAIYRAMREDPRTANFEYIWVRNKGVKVPQDVTNDCQVSFVEHGSLKHAHALLRAQYLICNSNFPPYFNRKKDQVYLPTWHGIPIKTLGFDANATLTNSSNTQRNFIVASGILMSNSYTTKHVVGSYGAPIDSRVHEIGSPRVDLVLNSDTNEVRRKLGIFDTKGIVLFAPTWRGKIGEVSTEIEHQLEAIQVLVEGLANDYHVLVSLHHLTRKALDDSSLGSSHVPDDVDICEVLAATDILISDYSSIVVDFLPLNRPIVLYTPDLEEYSDERGLYMDLNDFPATIVREPTRLLEQVLGAKTPDRFPNYEKIRDLMVPNEDGKASKRALEILLSHHAAEDIKAADGRKRILIVCGGLLSNGITSSFLSLMRNIDHDAYEVFVLVGADQLDKDEVKIQNFHEIDPRCRIILRTGVSAVERDVYETYIAFTKAGDVSDSGAVERIRGVFQREYRRLLGELRFDLAVDFSGYSPFWSMLIASANADRKVIYQHSDMLAELENSARQKNTLNSVFMSYRFYDEIVSVSKEVMETNLEKIGIYYGNASVQYVPNSLVIKNIVSKSRRPLSLTMINGSGIDLARDPDVVKFISIGRLSPEKRPDRVIRAFAKVVKNVENAALFIVGDGPMMEELQLLARRLRVADQIIFTGRLSNPYGLLRHCNCLVLPSDYEGQGIVLLEALTLGVPCVGTDIPAVRGIIGEENGIICEKNSESMACAMERVARGGFANPGFNAEEYVNDVMTRFYSKVCKDERQLH